MIIALSAGVAQCPVNHSLKIGLKSHSQARLRGVRCSCVFPGVKTILAIFITPMPRHQAVASRQGGLAQSSLSVPKDLDERGATSLTLFVFLLTRRFVLLR